MTVATAAVTGGFICSTWATSSQVCITLACSAAGSTCGVIDASPPRVVATLSMWAEVRVVCDAAWRICRSRGCPLAEVADA